jgi:hypothetical protein
MSELSCSLVFLDESTFAFGVCYKLRREYFEGRLTVELQVEGTIHDPHAASADFREDFLTREGLA